MRKLLYFTIGFAAACGAWTYLEEEGLRWAVLIFAIILFPPMGKDSSWIYRTAMVVLGCAAGIGWYAHYNSGYLDSAVSVDGKTLPVVIRTTEYSTPTKYGILAEGRTLLDGKSYQVRFYLDDVPAAEPGDQFAGRFQLRVNTKEGENPNLYQVGNGVFLTAYPQGTVTGRPMELTFRERPAIWRQKIKSAIMQTFPQDTEAFARALLLGDTSGLSYETDTDLKISGIRHVVAVSGLHISILFALLGMLTLHKRFLMAAAGFPLLVLFAAVAGFTPSVTRACLMCGLMLLAMVCNREYDGPTALAFAVLVMLLGNPMVICSVSFQLSVASVAGIFLFQPGIKQWMLSFFAEKKGKKLRTRLIHWFTSSVSVTLSAMSLTTPLCAYYFGMVSLVGVLTNLLTLWIVSGIFYGIIVVCLLYILLPGLSVYLAAFISVGIRYVLWIAEVFADFPLAAVYMESIYITAWLVFTYLLLAIFLIRESKQPLVLGCSIVMGLCLALNAAWLEEKDVDFRFTVLDVGQGQCLILQNEGKVFLVDCGGDSDSQTADLAAGFLLSRGITHLDGLILTHCDWDHAGGAPHILSRIDTELVILPAVPVDYSAYTDAKILWADRDLRIDMEHASVSIYVPVFPGSSNENSLCVLFDTEKCDILITGDRNAFGERSLLRNAVIPEVDVLIAGHHGSKNSTSEELLDAVSPETVIISAGRDNPYGHPSPEVLRRLAEHGCKVYRTDVQGTITVRR